MVKFLLAFFLVLIAVAFGWWWFFGDHQTPVFTLGPTVAPQDRPTPTPPAAGVESDDPTSGQTWSDKWVRFTDSPTVCDGILKFKGVTQNGAVMSRPGSDVVEFVIYRRSDLASTFLAGRISVPPILSFYQPTSYNDSLRLVDGFQRARRIWAYPHIPDFEFESAVPDYISADPGRFVLSMWGYRPGRDDDSLRLITLEDCEDPRSSVFSNGSALILSAGWPVASGVSVLGGSGGFWP